MTALGKIKPQNYADSNTYYCDGDFGSEWPGGRVECPGGDKEQTCQIQIATSENNSPSEGEICAHEGIWLCGVRMAEHSTVDNEFDDYCYRDIADSDNESSDEIDTHDKVQCQCKSQQNIRHHIEYGGVFAVMWLLVFGEGVFDGERTVKCISQFASNKNHECPAGFTVNAGPDEKHYR